MNSSIAEMSEDTAQDAATVQKADAAMLHSTFAKQKTAYLKAPEPSYEERMKDLATLKTMLMKHSREIKKAINADYGNRSNIESNLADIGASAMFIKDISKNLKKWMKPQRRHVSAVFMGAKNRVIPQPLGIVGVIVPWNFPIYLSIPPIATAFAAGNRAMVKMSENSRNLCKVLQEISPKYFPEEKLAFFDETGGVGIEFSKQPFDLMVFTGSPNTAKSVMAAAAKNLTPVILELGGKNPVIVDPQYSLEKAVDRIVFAKQTNAGQVCLNVDYVFVHESQVEEFVSLTKRAVKKMVPDINSKYFTSIIDDRSMARLEESLDDAEAKGARVINLSQQEINREERKFPLHLILDPKPDMQISQRETFGPAMTVRSYKKPEEVINFVNAGERPLGLYVFSDNSSLVQKYISNTMSGGVTINDVALHAGQDDMPFGGVGASGMGHYHGYEGFTSFSKMRPIFYQAKFSLLTMMTPPYTGRIGKMLDR